MEFRRNRSTTYEIFVLKQISLLEFHRLWTDFPYLLLEHHASPYLFFYADSSAYCSLPNFKSITNDTVSQVYNPFLNVVRTVNYCITCIWDRYLVFCLNMMRRESFDSWIFKMLVGYWHVRSISTDTCMAVGYFVAFGNDFRWSFFPLLWKQYAAEDIH